MDSIPNDHGPYSILRRALSERKRIRAVIRYAHGIRGTLTGHLLAFDKHMNLWMRDGMEVYSLPLHSNNLDPKQISLKDDSNSENDESFITLTPVQKEVMRRKFPVQQRQLYITLIRGDNIVMIYFAENERSAFPQTSKSPKVSLYSKNPLASGTSRRAEEKEKESSIGTMGSLCFAQQRRQQQY
eukprot:CAMPEP_0194196698 /NCGR_PEP_ID=MMETSP0154-20130528/76808_1 /TAXON_ID=1049557 /ORGANISM="Thalassiothrix antarctica, Strain L6-D1" /LENGTH=184 /DNA_ID=CAMNT_0038921313 /DNA_START=578 /DNA_END=1132 /DNA_ORIENTATION=+